MFLRNIADGKYPRLSVLPYFRYTAATSFATPGGWLGLPGFMFGREESTDHGESHAGPASPAVTENDREEDVRMPGGSGPVDRRRKRRWVYAGVLLLIIVALLVAVAATRKPAKPVAQNQRGGQPTPVGAVKAEKGDIDVYFTGLGTVTPLASVNVRSRVDGELLRVLFKEGQLVRKGELLAEIDDRPYKVQLTQAEGQLLKDEAALNNARVDLARYENLIKRNAVAQQVLATQQALVGQNEGAVKADQGLIDSAKLNIAYCHIASPINGRVGLRLVDPGNIVHANDQNGMMVITQMQPISVLFTIPEDQLQPVLGRINSGDKLRVDALDRNMTTTLAKGSLTNIDNQIDPSTGTLKLRASFDNRHTELFPNQFVNARLLVQQKRGVTLVPNAAIQRNQQNTFVYLVAPDHTVGIRNITLGTVEGEQAEVTSGLTPGDTVVTTGVDKLQEGSKVVPHVVTANNRSTK